MFDLMMSDLWGSTSGYCQIITFCLQTFLFFGTKTHMFFIEDY